MPPSLIQAYLYYVLGRQNYSDTFKFVAAIHTFPSGCFNILRRQNYSNTLNYMVAIHTFPSCHYDWHIFHREDPVPVILVFFFGVYYETLTSVVAQYLRIICVLIHSYLNEICSSTSARHLYTQSWNRIGKQYLLRSTTVGTFTNHVPVPKTNPAHVKLLHMPMLCSTHVWQGCS